jgi:outer membrane protein assembly factor BamB
MKQAMRIVAVFLALSLVFCAQFASVATSSVDDWVVSRHDSSQTGFSTSEAPTSGVVQLWNYTIEADSLSRPESPVVVDGRVYVGSADYGVCCFEASDGTKVWSFETESQIDSSPAVIEGRVYVGSNDGYVYCLDATDGYQVWNSSVDVSVNSPVNFVDGRVYVESTRGNVYCLDATNGEKLWDFSTGANSYRRSPAIFEGYVFVSNENGDIFCLDAPSGAHIWDFSVGDAVGSPAAVDGFVYFGSRDGNAYCLNASNGDKIWNYTTWYNSAGPAHGYEWGNTVSDPAIAYGYVYLGSSDFDVFCLDALTGEKVWNFSTGGIVHAPSVAGGCVFAGSYDGNVYCINASSGAEIWRGVAGVFSPVSVSGSAGPPVIADGVVYVVGNGVLSAWGSPMDESQDSTFPLLELTVVIIVIIFATATISYIYSKRK